MRNQKRTLFILLAILAALILLILFVIPNLGKTAPAEESDDRIFLCDMDRTDITSIEFIAAGSCRTVSLSGDSWIWEDGTVADQDEISNMLSAISGLYSTQTAYQGAEHFSDCGLDSPTLVITAFASQQSVLITVGSYNNALDRWYCTVNGGDEIYLIGNNLPTRFGVK